MKTNPEAYTLSGGIRGFTLVEILIAIAIFSIGILALGSMQLGAVKNNTTGNITTQATMLARDQLENLKAIANVTTLASGADATPIDADGNPGGIFTRQWSVTNPLGGSESRQIQVSVSWSRRGQNRTVVLTTITRGSGI